MITDKDVTKLKKVFVTKEEFTTAKTDIAELKEDMVAVKETTQAIMTGVDKILGKLDNLNHEYVALKLSDDRQNKQIQQIATKVDLKLEM